MDFIPSDVRGVLETLKESGFEAWVVGGAVRDHLLGRVAKDWDVVTSAEPNQVMGLFTRVIPVGIRHGTVRIHLSDRDIEVTTLRVRGDRDILHDLGRRDFTVNAMAYSFPEGRLLDPFGGAADLRDGVLRAVGCARSRFREDPLRVLRAGRLVSVYGFVLEASTADALADEAPGLARVAPERIRDELLKLLTGDHSRRALREMAFRGVIREVVPELTEPWSPLRGQENRQGTLERAIETVPRCRPLARVRLAALLHGLPGYARRIPVEGVPRETTKALETPASARGVLRRLRVSRKMEDEVVTLLENQLPGGVEDWTDGDIRRFLAKLKEDLLDDALDLARASRLAAGCGDAAMDRFLAFQGRLYDILAEHPPLGIADLALNGLEIMRILGEPPGPKVGEALKRLQDLVLDDPGRNRRKFLMDFLAKAYDIKF